MQVPSFVLILLMVVMALVADYFLKIAGQKPEMLNRFFLAGMAIYATTAFIWYVVLKNIKFASANLFYSLFTVLLSVVMGVILFKETLFPVEIVGIVLAISSILILSRFA